MMVQKCQQVMDCMFLEGKRPCTACPGHQANLTMTFMEVGLLDARILTLGVAHEMKVENYRP